MKWKDISTYSKGDVDRSSNSLLAKAGKLTICVHRHIHYPADTWLLSCKPFFDLKVLKSKNIDEAKAEAIELVRREVKLASDAFGAVQ